MSGIESLDDQQFLDPNTELNVKEIDLTKTKVNFSSPHGFTDQIGPSQLVKLKKFAQSFNLYQNQYFEPNQIANRHGSDCIDVVVQFPDYSGFQTRNNRSYQTKIKMPLKDYIQYYNNINKLGFLQRFRYKEQVSQGQILFAVNIDMETWKEELAFLGQTLPDKIKYRSKCDALSYCKQQISGITQPQVYIKVQNCWTGGHQENLCVRSVNLNFGPDSSTWYAINPTQVKLLRDNLNQLQNYDILKNEGLWFVLPEQLEPFGIKPVQMVQEPGDLVIVGPGCMHWVKAQGKAVQISWNFVQKDYIDVSKYKKNELDNKQFALQLKMMYQRAQLNKKIHRENMIPLKSIYLEILNHELLSLDFMAMQFIFEKINQFYLEDHMQLHKVKQLYQDLGQPNTTNNNNQSKLTSNTQKITKYCFFQEASAEKRKVTYCHVCFQEIFNYWCLCQCCNDIDINICIYCYKNHIDLCRDPREIKFLIKYKPYVFTILNRTIKKFIQLLQDGRSIKLYKELPQLCSSHLYIGQVNNCQQNDIQGDNPLDEQQTCGLNEIIQKFDQLIQFLDQHDEDVSEDKPFYNESLQILDQAKKYCKQVLNFQCNDQIDSQIQDINQSQVKQIKRVSFLTDKQHNPEKLQNRIQYEQTEFAICSEDDELCESYDNLQPSPNNSLYENKNNSNKNYCNNENYSNEQEDQIEIQSYNNCQNGSDNQDLITIDLKNINRKQECRDKLDNQINQDDSNEISEEEIKNEELINYVIIVKNQTK